MLLEDRDCKHQTGLGIGRGDGNRMMFEHLSLAKHPGRLPDAIALRFDHVQGSSDDFKRFGIGCPAAVERAVPKRKAEYLAGRRVAIHALREAGIEVTDVRMGTTRAPLWPEGYTGSITHSDDMAAAIALPEYKARGIGIDLENVASADAMAAIRQVALSPSEQGVLNELARRFGEQTAVTIAFSAKESLYKATASSVGRVFDFTAVHILSAHADQGIIKARIVEALSTDLMPGRVLSLGFSVLSRGDVFTSCIWCPWQRDD